VGWVLAVVVISILTAYIRAQRWRVLLRPVGQVPLYPAISATAIGFGATSVLPFRVGEFVRPVMLARNTRVPVSAALSGVVLGGLVGVRLFAMLLVSACALVVSIVNPRVPDWLRQGAYAMVPIVAVGFGVLVA